MSIAAPSTRPWRRAWAAGLLARAMALALVLALLVLAPQAHAAADPQRWTLTDTAGHRWGLSLFEQPDCPEGTGWRLRLTARSPGQQADHQRPLPVRDGLGAAWSLPNRSAELVGSAEQGIPAASAQFDAGALMPRPHEALPLRLEVPIEGEDQATLVLLPPAVVQALHGLPAQAELRAASRA